MFLFFVVFLFSKKTANLAGLYINYFEIYKRMSASWFLIAVVIILILCVFGVHISNNSAKHAFERFENEVKQSSIECPKTALRTPDGKIQVQPGNKNFETMNEYLAYLNDLYAKGSMCIPPKVTGNSQPIAGILGGLGTNTEGPEGTNLQGNGRELLDYSSAHEETYTNKAVDKLDDYEYSRVFETESGIRNSLTKESKGELINKHVLDWANLPFNSEKRAEKEDTFVAGRKENGFRDPETGVFFQAIEGKNIDPPDMDAIKEREQKVMSSYKPTDVSKHTINDQMRTVSRIVNEAYKGDKNWEPVVTQVSDYQWEVTELRPREKREKYEGETKDLALAEQRGEALPPPSISIDDRNRDDPYFDKSGVGDRDNNKYWKYEDFSKWTPGLERMFAPTLSNKEWT